LTIGEYRAVYFRELAQYYPISEARAIASVVFEDVTGLKSLYQSMSAFQVLTFEQQKLLAEYLKRLQNFEPMQYILGYEIFGDIKLKVNPTVLIPRPETLDLVNWIINSENTPKSILDIGTGSGCIAIALKKHYSSALIHALELSEDALQTAKENATMNEVEIGFEQSDILNDFPKGKYDIIVSNPPYVSEKEKEEMRPNVLKYEPHLALFSADPLLFYERIAHVAYEILNPGGKLYFEMNEYYENEIIKVVAAAGYSNIEIKEDIFGKNRMIRGEKL
jgi:release factor glutamine methyltransferase